MLIIGSRVLKIHLATSHRYRAQEVPDSIANLPFAGMTEACIGDVGYGEVRPSQKSTAGRGNPVCPENAFTPALCFQFRIMSEDPTRVE
jgi:hypothetical protein